MEDALALLKSEGLLKDWSDNQILPGRNISAAVKAHMDNDDIIVFLLSPAFIASDECMKEWKYAKHLARAGRPLVRIPIILRVCPWLDLLGTDDIKALPNDGLPVAEFDDQDTAWLQVYEGIKAVVNELRNTFTAKAEFLAELEKTDFLSQQHIKLQDIFVFLPLVRLDSQDNEDGRPYETVYDAEALLNKRYSLVHGVDRSGKTALGRHIFLTLVEQSKPVLYVDLNEVHQLPNNEFFRRVYRSQFNGDFSLWNQQTGKSLVLDNLSGRPHLIDFVVAAKESFDRIVITLASDVFYSFFRDDSRIADFEILQICPLTHALQESLIRKRLSLSSRDAPLSDGYIDQIENRVNAIIVSDKVVPRYPFFVLCILQTYEAYMPSGLNITSYGHCYYALIVASLIRAGVSNEDSDINACFNFARNLAFSIYQYSNDNADVAFEFNNFIREYRSDFFISMSIINRLRDSEFGLLTGEGQFRKPYMQYYFLGMFLSKDSASNRTLLERMCDASHVPANYLTLLFTIHHTDDARIIDDILLRSMIALEEVRPATLDRTETRIFQDIVRALPASILSKEQVASARRREREALDDSAFPVDDLNGFEYSEGSEVEDAVNGVYRILKNNEIMGQIIRNRYGSMKRGKVEEIIEIVADSGLRLVNFVLKNGDEIREMARYENAKDRDFDIEEIKDVLSGFSFIWTMVNVGHIIGCINAPETRSAVNAVVGRRNTPAYDLIGYFTLLDAAQKLDDRVKNELTRLLKQHKDPFIRRVLSLRTQHYMNTHFGKARIEQAVCALLGIKYLPRLVRRQ